MAWGGYSQHISVWNAWSDYWCSYDFAPLSEYICQIAHKHCQRDHDTKCLTVHNVLLKQRYPLALRSAQGVLKNFKAIFIKCCSSSLCLYAKNASLFSNSDGVKWIPHLSLMLQGLARVYTPLWSLWAAWFSPISSGILLHSMQANMFAMFNDAKNVPE